LFQNLQLLLRLWIHPVDAMGRILDRANLLFSSVLVICMSLALQYGVARWIHFPFYTPLLLLAVVYVPGAIVLGVLIGHLGSFGTVFSRD